MRSDNPIHNKSQATIFLLISIFILLVLVILVFTTAGTISLSFLKQTNHPLPFYIEECMKFQIVDAVEILTSQGGFIYYFEPNLTTSKRVFAYSIKDNSNTSPSREFMESEISRYMVDHIQECIDNSSFDITTSGIPRAKTIIFPETIDVQLDYEMTVPYGDSNISFMDFRADHPLPLGRMVELRDTIVKDLIDYPNLMLLDKLYDTDFEMIINPYTGRIKVIDMINTSARLRNDPLTFSFAMHDLHSLKSNLEFIDMPTDMTLPRGIPIQISVACNRKCKYYDDTILFDIDEDTGIIDYTPTELDVGMHNITITITDDTYTSLKNFMITVV
ncbi:hypothetical protein H6503_00430 [Candidatus Woesearchaeota archaeon]|nr:hypothetical protein [Candidatus Woesearchaeota archaeon]